jgi:hypothetical protein
MDQRRGTNHWINPLLTKLNLIQAKEMDADFRHYWSQIEECQLLERIGGVIAEINGAAGYHVLELIEFLPPQKKVIRVSFDRNRVRYNMEIVLRSDGILLLFSTSRRFSAGWDRYFHQTSMRHNSAVSWEQMVKPEEILERDIQVWFSYLLSGLEKRFRPDNQEQLIEASNSVLDTAFRKASA